MATWDESEHPRDDEGKFTFKNGGASSGGSNSNSLKREDILYPTMKDKEPNYDDTFKGLGNYNNENLSREDILYPTMKDKETNYDDIFKGLGNYNNENLSREDILNEHDGISTGAAASIVTDEIAGIKKGNSMSIEDAVKGTNPNYDAFGNITYKVNCQACVAVAEARIRGYDLEVNIGLDSDIKRELGKRPNIAFIDPKTGKTPEFTISKAKNELDCINWLDSTVGQGERYIFAFQWKGKGYDGRFKAHILTVTKDKNNQLKFYDPQIGIKRDLELLSRIQYKFDWKEEPFPPKLLRVDDKKLNLKVMNQISKRTTRKNN